MKRQKSLSLLFATIGLLVFLQSCANNNDSQLGAEETLTRAQTIPLPTPEPPKDPLAEFDMAKSDRWTDTAKLIAGMKVEDTSAFADIQKSNAWINHRNFLENAWAKLEPQQLSKVRKWSAEELKSINASSPSIFYPFSGPDFLYAYSLFPQASEYVLVALEPVGTIPDFEKLSASERNLKLQQIRGSLHAIMQWSFFRTNDMKVDMARQGTVPFLFLFMARTNNRILDVEYIGLDKEANIQKLDEGMIPGVKISFVPEGERNPRTLYYFSTDLSNAGLEKTPEFNEFVKKFDKPVTYLKAASYLMHYSNFSTIRNLVLSQSVSLLQDDSGIPVKAFNSDKWNLNFYGNYTPPRAPFNQEEYQPDLMKIYRSNSNIKKIDFGIGYNFGLNESNLMLAIAKDNPQSQP
ncbi:MAG: hypothetical protein AB4426_04800 [Xenococcaceae cyanobacterium]